MVKRDRKEYMKQWREANKERIRERQRAYREANKEKLAAQERAYRETNKESIQEREKAYREANKGSRSQKHKEYREANKERIAEQRKTYYREIRRGQIQESVENWLKSKLKKIKKREHLTIGDLLKLYDQQDGRCALSGLKMSTHFNSHIAISIDRIDSNQGYEVGNIQLVCVALNLAKKHHSNDSILEFIRLIRESS